MESIKKLDQISVILEKGFFQEHLDIFMAWFQQSNNCPGKQWDGRDEFGYVKQHSAGNIYTTYSLSKGLRREIEDKFSELEVAFLTDIVNLDEIEQNNLIEIIRQKLKIIKSSANELSLPQDYHLLILNYFNNCENGFYDLLDDYNYPRISKNGFYYRRLGTKEGQRAFKRFYKEVVSYRFIDREISENEFKDLFSQRKLAKKIIWGGSPEEAHYFFTALDAKEFIETNSIWLTVGEHFLIRKKRGGFFQSEKLRGLPQFNEEDNEDKKRMREIRSLINELDV